MTKKARKMGCRAVAFIAAFMLMLPATLNAFAIANGPQPRQLDIFGNVICTHAGIGELPARDSHRQALPPCCTFGCLLSAPPLGSVPAALILSRSIVFETAAFAAPLPAPPLVPRARSSAYPRAPPPMA